MTAIAELVVSGSIDAWRRAGFEIADDGVAVVGPVRVLIVPIPPEGNPTMRSWGLSAPPHELPELIDGIETAEVEPVGEPAPADVHEIGAVGVDHVVVMTPSLERTCDALFAATGEPLKRVREAGGGVLQGFHRFGPVIVEVVETPQTAGDGPARLWGVVFNVADLDGAARRLGPEMISDPKPAVQRDRSIATFRTAAGLGVPVALMSPTPPVLR